jgi:hypothetical protein
MAALGTVLVLVGDLLEQRVAASVPGGKLQVVKGGHRIQDEHPRVVVAAVRSVLTKTR